MKFKFNGTKINGGAAMLLIILILVISFFSTALLFWALTLALGAFGIVLTFTWGRAFAFWIICAIIRTLFGGLIRKEND